uniref:FERM domain containing 4A n=1 Tax=Petromyzon marinus TaxID=7757 RepID=S4R7V4_PETMA
RRLSERRRLCAQELTGRLPSDFPLAAGEKPPAVRRRVGTSFKLDEKKMVPRGEEEELDSLERDFAIQTQITEAAKKLVSDPHIGKTMRRQRKTSLQNATRKLQQIEGAINEYRLRAGKEPTQRASLFIEEGKEQSEDSSLSDAAILEDSVMTIVLYILPHQHSHQHVHPHAGVAYARPPPPHSLDGLALRRIQSFRTDAPDYDKSPIKPRAWKESSLDEPYQKPKKQSKDGNQASPVHGPGAGAGVGGAGPPDSLQGSPVHAPAYFCSVPSTPDLRSRGILRHKQQQQQQQSSSVDVSPAHSCPPPEAFRNRSGSLECGPSLLPSAEDPYGTATSHSSASSDVPDDRLSCASQCSSEREPCCGSGYGCGYGYGTLGEESLHQARQRHRSAGSLGSASSGSLPNLAPNAGPSGTARSDQQHHRSVPNSASQYRIKEYPLYTDGAAWPTTVVRSLESDREGHYSVKAQLRVSNSYTAGGLYRDSAHYRGGGGGNGTHGGVPHSRSQLVRTPVSSPGQHANSQWGSQALIDHLRSWYERNAHRDPRRLSHASSGSDRSSQSDRSSR